MVTTSYDSGQGAGPGRNGRDPLGSLQEGARTALHDVQEQGSAQFEAYRDSAADQLEALAESARVAGEQLDERDSLGVSHYISDMARSMGSLAEGLRGKSADELLHQAGRLARDNPALFLAGSVAVGFGLSRLLRASAEDSGEPFTDGRGHDGKAADSDAWVDEGVRAVIAADEDVPVTPPHTGDAHSGTVGGPAVSTTPPSSAIDRLSPDSLNDGNPNKGDLE